MGPPPGRVKPQDLEHRKCQFFRPTQVVRQAGCPVPSEGRTLVTVEIPQQLDFVSVQFRSVWGHEQIRFQLARGFVDSENQALVPYQITPQKS